MTVSVCSSFCMWPFRFVAFSVCYRFHLWPLRFVAVSVSAVSVCGRYDLLPDVRSSIGRIHSPAWCRGVQTPRRWAQAMESCTHTQLNNTIENNCIQAIIQNQEWSRTNPKDISWYNMLLWLWYCIIHRKTLLGNSFFSLSLKILTYVWCVIMM